LIKINRQLLGMEELQNQLARLKETHQAIEKDIREYNSKLGSLEFEKDDLEINIGLVKDKILILSDVLTDDQESKLKDDISRIVKLHKNLDSEDSLTLKLVDNEIPGADYSISISGSLENCTITISTSSETIKNRIRKSFTQNTGCHDENVDNTHRTEWYMGPYGCCSRSFQCEVVDSHISGRWRGRGRGRGR